MEKIKSLLDQLGGGSKELTEAIISELDKYKKTVDENSDKKYKAKLAAVKNVCLEELNNYKIGLAKKVRIYLESKNGKIEEQIAKQVALKEPAAAAKLNAIAQLIEGIQINGNAEAELQALKQTVAQLNQDKVLALNEGKALRDRLARAEEIARATLDRNKQLVEALNKEKTTKKAVISEDKVTPAKPATTRPSKDHQIPTRKTTAAPAAPAPVITGSDPAAIAATME